MVCAIGSEADQVGRYLSEERNSNCEVTDFFYIHLKALCSWRVKRGREAVAKNNDMHWSWTGSPVVRPCLQTTRHLCL